MSSAASAAGSISINEINSMIPAAKPREFVFGLLGYFGLDRLLPHAHPQDLMTPAAPRPRNLRATPMPSSRLLLAVT
jgi:ZIP family zinc transporter